MGVERVLVVGKVWVERVYMKVGKVYSEEGRGRCMEEKGGKVYGGDGRGGMSQDLPG